MSEPYDRPQPGAPGGPSGGGPGGYGQQPPPGYGPPPGQQPYRGGPPPGRAADLNPADQRLWSTLTHVVGVVLVASFVAPLIAYLVLKDRGPFVREQTREALNFQIFMVILWVASSVLSLLTFGLATVLVGIFGVVFAVLAAIAANRGQNYRYPITIRFVR